MYGVIFFEFQRFVEAHLGKDAWNKVVKEAQLEKKIYLPISEYPDEEAVALISTAAKIIGKPLPIVLESFGTFITPALLKMYQKMIRPEWRTLDLIENTEQTMHKVVRIRNPGAAPPRLQCKRINPNEVLLVYTSQRKMCALAKGITYGVARHYGERIRIVENSCMNQGDRICEMRILLVKKNSKPPSNPI